jgi:hypothetical protein
MGLLGHDVFRVCVCVIVSGRMPRGIRIRIRIRIEGGL